MVITQSLKEKIEKFNLKYQDYWRIELPVKSVKTFKPDCMHDCIPVVVDFSMGHDHLLEAFIKKSEFEAYLDDKLSDDSKH